jgi:hypothetical protein
LKRWHLVSIAYMTRADQRHALRAADIYLKDRL